jgi:hypothetical protein
MKFLPIHSAFLFLAIPLLCADQITLKNGDRVTGSIVKMDGGNLTVRSAHFGTITMPWAEVESVTTDEPLHAELANGQILEGTLELQGGSAEVATASGSRSAEVSELVALRDNATQQDYERLLAPGWLDIWTGTYNLGWSGAKGNAQTLTFTTGIDVARATNADKTSAYFNIIKASARVDGQSSSTAKAVRGGWAYSRNSGQSLFVNVFNDYEFDAFQSLDLRFVAGGGLGYSVWKNAGRRFDLLAGIAYTRESFSTPLIRNSADVYWGNDLTFRLNSITTLSQSYRMFNKLSDSGDFRVNFDVDAVNKLTQWLSWNVSLSDRYSNNPAPGRLNNDFLYSTGLGLTFGQ